MNNWKKILAAAPPGKAGAAIAGAVHAFVQPVVSFGRRNFAVAIALLLLGFPVPRVLPNVHADRTYAALEEIAVCNHFSSRGNVNSARRDPY